MTPARNLRWVGWLARIGSMTGVAILTVFHGWLFAECLAAGELLEPAVGLRWLASLVLVAALVALRRAGVSLVHGRRALVFWVLVLLLHWSATPVAERGLDAGELLIAAPGAFTLVAGIAWLLGRTRRSRGDRPERRPAPAPPFFAPVALPWLLLALAPRPPPR